MIKQRILRLPTVLNETGKKKSALYAEMLEGKFPKNIRLGPRQVGWLEEDIQNYIRERIAASRGASSR